MTTPSAKARPKRHAAAVLAALATLCVGVGLAVLLQYLALDTASVFVVLILVALAVYLIASGQLEELVLPGGGGVKLRALGDSAVRADIGETVEPTDLTVIQKGSRVALQEIRGQILSGDGGPLALTLTLGNTSYRAPDLRAYLHLLMASDPMVAVIFLDQEGRFCGSTLGVKLAAVLGEGSDLAADDSIPSDDTIESAAFSVVDAIRHNRFEELRELLSITTKAVFPDDTNRAVLDRMLSEDVPLLIVLDQSNGAPKGMVKRDVLTARMLNQIVSQ